MTEAESSAPLEYRLRLQAPPDGADYWLLQYLKQGAHVTYSDKELVLSALRMCWLPLAYRHYADRMGLSRDELRQISLDAILRLKEQIQYIAAVMDLERPNAAIASTLSPQPSPRPPRPIAPTPTPTADDGYGVDLFGDD